MTSPLKAETSAVSMDRDLRALAREISADVEEFTRLLAEAQKGKIHLQLGYKSWPKYVANVLSTDMAPLHRSHRSVVVSMLTHAGMSTRDIGWALNVDAKTVRNDQEKLVAGGENFPTSTKGGDGKTYQKPAAKSHGSTKAKAAPKAKTHPVIADLSIADMPRRVADIADWLVATAAYLEALPETARADIRVALRIDADEVNDLNACVGALNRILAALAI